MNAGRSLLETLEERIAPALLVHGANLLGGSQEKTGETSVGTDAVMLVRVNSGQALVWFDAYENEITGISLGHMANVEVFGDVRGDIVTNLAASGLLSDSDNDSSNGEDGNVLLANTIAALTIKKTLYSEGSVGNVVAGGGISRLSVDGAISGIYAGNGAFDTASNLVVDGAFEVAVGVAVQPSGTGPRGFVFHTTAAQALSGASIANVSVGLGVNLQIIAGDGTVSGGAGGSISNVKINGATVSGTSDVSYFIKAGDGANGVTGGAGGSITGVTEKGSSQTAIYRAGDGGNAIGFGALSGGAGGTISRISAESDQTSYEVTAGSGGHGIFVDPADPLASFGLAGGNGGSILQSNFFVRDLSGLLVAGDFTKNGFQDVVVVDSGSGQMVLMAGSEQGFSPVLQGGSSAFIAGVGVGPRTIQAGDVNGDGALDFVVLYSNSANFGVFLNNGSGVFTSASFSAGVAPVDLVLGNFVGGEALDVSILSSSAAGNRISVAEGNGAGGFNLLGTTIDLGRSRNAVDMIGANIDGNSLTDLFVGYSDGWIRPLLATGSAASLFQSGSAVRAQIDPTVPPEARTPLRISSLDAQGGQLLAFSSTDRAAVVFTISGGSIVQDTFSPAITTLPGQAVAARLDSAGSGKIQVLTVEAASSTITEFSRGDQAYSTTSSAGATERLRAFIPLADSKVAALTGSLTQMAFTAGGTEFSYAELPFTGKSVVLTAGDGGNGFRGNGGAGGAISGLRAETAGIEISTGRGGASQFLAGGAGGAFMGGAGVIKAETKFELTTGAGGSGGTHGGSGGAISSTSVSLGNGGIASLTSGAGGSAGSGRGGAGGSAAGLTVLSKGESFSLTLGDGGVSATGAAGGAGGGLVRFTLSHALDAKAELLPKPIMVQVSAGQGGNAPTGTGGLGGSLSSVRITVDPSNLVRTEETTLTSTAIVSLTGGKGGNGAVGGAGGSLSSVQVTAILDQAGDRPATLVFNFAVLSATAGSGGAGSTGNGGAGGSVLGLQTKNITTYGPESPFADRPALVVLAGNGGAGAAAGGAGGRIANVSASNGIGLSGPIKGTLLDSAYFAAGTGGAGGTGNGGAGGGLSSILAGVASAGLGTLEAFAGSGGNSASARGGAGGSVTGSVFATTNVAAAFGFPSFSLLISAGNGGSGLIGGGVGGALTSLSLQTPAQDAQIFGQGDIFGGVLRAGNGGNATSTTDIRAAGGAGGNITGITQAKDLNSFMSLLMAGAGGDSAAGTGGAGGSVTSVRTAGFIGRPFETSGDRLGAFDDGLPQGIFAGLGGSGALSNGLVGAVTNIIARQISAIGAGANVALETGLFAAARAVTNVRADLIGYDVNNNGIFEGPGTPSGTVPVDGFILATSVSNITTQNPGRTAAFTFSS